MGTSPTTEEVEARKKEVLRRRDAEVAAAPGIVKQLLESKKPLEFDFAPDYDLGVNVTFFRDELVQGDLRLAQSSADATGTVCGLLLRCG